MPISLHGPDVSFAAKGDAQGTAEAIAWSMSRSADHRSPARLSRRARRLRQFHPRDQTDRASRPAPNAPRYASPLDAMPSGAMTRLDVQARTVGGRQSRGRATVSASVSTITFSHMGLGHFAARQELQHCLDIPIVLEDPRIVRPPLKAILVPHEIGGIVAERGVTGGNDGAGPLERHGPLPLLLAHQAFVHRETRFRRGEFLAPANQHRTGKERGDAPSRSCPHAQTAGRLPAQGRAASIS